MCHPLIRSGYLLFTPTPSSTLKTGTGVSFVGLVHRPPRRVSPKDLDILRVVSFSLSGRGGHGVDRGGV